MNIKRPFLVEGDVIALKGIEALVISDNREIADDKPSILVDIDGDVESWAWHPTASQACKLVYSSNEKQNKTIKGQVTCASCEYKGQKAYLMIEVENSGVLGTCIGQTVTIVYEE